MSGAADTKYRWNSNKEESVGIRQNTDRIWYALPAIKRRYRWHGSILLQKVYFRPQLHSWSRQSHLYPVICSLVSPSFCSHGSVGNQISRRTFNLPSAVSQCQKGPGQHTSVQWERYFKALYYTHTGHSRQRSITSALKFYTCTLPTLLAV